MRKKLLLADDSITIQKVVELTFPSDEFEVVTAGNGRIAVDKATTFLPDFVLCDVIMPQLDGYQVCEALRAMPELQNVPILLLNGAFEAYDAERARSVGALGNVSKPFDPPALVSRVKAILAERAAASVEEGTLPMSLGALAAAQPQDDSKTLEAGVPASTVPHEFSQEFSYDDSETNPVSTVDVPMSVRELAARSLSLDAPVFASPEPDVLTAEAEISFSETLHGPLDASEQVPYGAPMETGGAESIEEAAAIEETEPVAGTGEFEAPGTIEPGTIEEEVTSAPAQAFESAMPETPAAEPMDFEVGSDLAAEVELPKTLPPMDSLFLAAPPAAVEPLDAEREFPAEGLGDGTAEFPDPYEAAAVGETPVEPSSSLEATAPDAMGLPDGFDGSEPTADSAPGPALAEASVAEGAQSEALEEPASDPFAAVAEFGSFDGLLASPDPAPPAAAPAMVRTPSTAFAATVPSAEVSVPVDMVQQIAQRVISQVSERVIREIAWDVIPGLAEKLIRAEIERIKARAESERD